MTSLPPELQLVLSSLLIRYTEDLAKYRKEYEREGLALASFHFAPDGAWIAIEHEKTASLDEPFLDEPFIVRLSPACHQLLLKI